jgi:hypothetical protein
MAVEKGDGLVLNNLGGSEMDPPQKCNKAAWGAHWRSLEERGVRESHGQ